MNKVIIRAKLPSLNEYVRACRSNKYAGSEFKKSIESLIGLSIVRAKRKGTLKPVSNPCIIHIVWHESTRKRDVDNIQSAQKFILDALQYNRIIINDSRKYVKQIYHTVVDDKEDYVEVSITEE